MAVLTAPKGAIPIGLLNIAGRQYEVSLHPEWLRYLTQGLFDRAGGSSGPSTTDLATSAFEDSGVEELRLDSYRLLDELRQLPPTIQAIADDPQTPPYEPMPWPDPLTPIYETAAQPEDQAARVEALEAQMAEIARQIDALMQGLAA